MSSLTLVKGAVKVWYDLLDIYANILVLFRIRNKSHFLLKIIYPRACMMLQHKLSSHETWLYPTFVWLIQLLTTLALAFLFTHLFMSHHGTYPLFGAWDGGIYLGIAEKGYVFLKSTAFYPLYPLLMRGLHTITGFSYEVSGVIISNISLWLALIFLYRLIIMEHNQLIARQSLWLLTGFPVAMFYHCIYTESLNLLFLVLFFYYLHSNRWYPAIVAGAFAAITHGFGMVLIFPGLAYLWQKRHQFTTGTLWLRALSLLLIFTGVILYMIFLYIKTGTPFSFIFAHRFWAHKTIIPVLHIFTYLGGLLWNEKAIESYTIVEIIHGVFALMMVLMGVLMLIKYRKKFNFPMQLFYIIAVLLSISSGPGGHLDSFARYEMVLFPGFIVWSYLCEHREWFLILSLSIMIPLKTILLGMFVNGYWIT